MRLSASLVLFCGDPNQFGRAIYSYLHSGDGVLYVIDNSPHPLKHELFSHPRVRYQFTGRNLGFGAAHNVAIRQLAGQSDLHLLLNPDVEFDAGVLPVMMAKMFSQPDVGALMPRIVYPDGQLQRLCKLLPSPTDLIFRRFFPSSRLRERINRRYELHALRHEQPMDIPNLSGCFLLLRTDLLLRVGGFDERYFMYMEDVDLVRRIGEFARTVYEPSVVVTHDYAKGSYKNKQLLGYHLKSAVTYFNKWGWLRDPTRSRRNSQTLKSIRTR